MTDWTTQRVFWLSGYSLRKSAGKCTVYSICNLWHELKTKKILGSERLLFNQVCYI